MGKIVSQFGHVIICPPEYRVGAISGLARIHIQPRLKKRVQPSRVRPNTVGNLLFYRGESLHPGHVGCEGICSIFPLLEGPHAF